MKTDFSMRWFGIPSEKVVKFWALLGSLPKLPPHEIWVNEYESGRLSDYRHLTREAAESHNVRRDFSRTVKWREVMEEWE